MQNLRIVNVKVIDSSHIEVTFTSNLTSNLITANASVLSDTPGVSDSEVLEIQILGPVLAITCQPLTPLGAYFLKFQSVLPLYPFQSVNGTALLPEDGIANKYLITAPIGADNPIKNFLDTYYHGNIYDHDNDNTLVAKFIQSLAVNLSRALYDIRQVKNENYLNFDVVDEPKIRGTGPTDRLNEEGAYEISRVGRTATGTSVSNIFPFEIFPTSPVTLQKTDHIEFLTANSINEKGFFNINDLILNLDTFPVTKLTSLVFTLNSSEPIYTYDITTLGYQILDSRYDQEYGFTYLQLENNQIKLNDKILEDPLFSLDSIIRVEARYESKNRGIVVDPTTVTVYTIKDSIREVLPPIVNVFNLKYAPIVDVANGVPVLAGVTFINPNSNVDPVHPAFKYEIPYRLESLPVTPGQYSVDYASGTVYVYGESLTNDGTGPFPPLATYKYRHTYQSELDYVYDPDLLDLVSLPTGSLRDFDGTISFSYEEVFIPDVDYVSSVHLEALTERVGNNLVALNAFKTKNAPITNVFRILNETSGEIYTLNRWNNDKIYFRCNTPPRINAQSNENSVFETITNELLFVNTTVTNSGNYRIFVIPLNNNNLISSTEDAFASSVNTSLTFSNANIFESEKWFDINLDLEVNLERLTGVGEYIVDYIDGIIYCNVATSQDFNIGAATYKHKKIITTFPHVITPDDIYYQLSPTDPKSKTFNVQSFGDGFIIPETLDYSDEALLNSTLSSPYQLFNGAVGSFVDGVFVSGVSNQIKFVRGIFEFKDLSNSTHPFNFAQGTTSTGFNITVSPIVKQAFDAVQFDGTNYFININENIPYLSSNITYTFSVIRSSDGAELWDSTTGTIVPGNPVALQLSGLNSPQAGDQVLITYSIAVNDLTRVIVDYNKGDYFIDYTYLADEIIVSYEYGDNVLDFRHSLSVPSNTDYFVSYKVGALRDALLKNFGNLVNVEELNTFDVDFNRERYRDALRAALTSFIQGPTINAIKNIGKTISHIDPIITESAFIDWSLGNSLLYPQDISTTGAFQMLPAKFSNGVLIDGASQTISLPVNSNIRFEEGTFETWVAPQWNGLDNDAELTFSILKDGYAIPANQIFVGAAEAHPELSGGTFNISKSQNIIGVPNTNKDGVFIYYDKDISGNFNRWYIRVIDGYVAPLSSAYKIVITSTGNFYDSKSYNIPKPTNLSILTGTKSLTLNITATSSGIDEGVTFLSDIDHYILDFGKEVNKSRLSIFKDVSGYINFRVYDNRKTSFAVSADVSNWRAGDLHHVAASWKLNTFNGRDELHLFLDGFEVPNIIKYGQKLQPYLHEKFRAINQEEIIGLIDRDIVSSIDLHTEIGSAVVTSSLNFSSYNIFIGDNIIIDELGFNPAGYSITNISGQTLTLSDTMPLTLTDGRFTINRTQFTVNSDIDVAPNVAVYTVHPVLTGTDIDGIMGSDIVTSASVDFEVEGIEAGSLIRINNNFLEPTYHILQVSGNSLALTDPMPVGFSATSFQIYDNNEVEIPGVRAVRPAYSISKDVNFNNELTISNDVFAGDLVLVKTLGLNHRKVKKQYYVWSDGYENILKTQLPPPISLDEVKITKILLSSSMVGPSNSTFNLGQFTSPNFTTTPLSVSTFGRTVSLTIAGNNVDFNTPVSVVIDGVSGGVSVAETVLFSEYGTLDSVNLFTSINFISVVVTPVSSSRNALTISAKEKYAITHSENDSFAPIVRYSYPIGAGYTLYNDSAFSVRDDSFTFSSLDIGNYLLIQQPALVAGYYLITGLSADRKSIFIQPSNQSSPQVIPDFIDGSYQVLNVNQYRSGLQNGFFTLEIQDMPSQKYFLSSGLYELEYSTYTRISLEPLNSQAYLGSDFHGYNQLNGIMDQIKVYSTMLTDTRIGETIPSNQRSITKDFNSLKALKADINTLMLISFDAFPFVNSAKYYINKNTEKQHFQSSIVLNENFNNSLVFLDKPVVLENEGILDTKKEGTIEFWMNPLFDTSNDPHDRYFFDAYGAVVEETVSVNNTALKLSSPASKIISVKLAAGDDRVDYFAGGKIEIDTQHAIQEESNSISASVVTVSKSILQVISVKIIGDLTGIDYFANGSIGTNLKTIYLGTALPSASMPVIVTYQSTDNKNITLNTQIIRLNRKLPYQNTKVVVNYIPQGLQGDRISIFKDKVGYMNFSITASGTNYVVRAPTLWSHDTWHRVKASYKVNGGAGHDEMRLFLDGYEFVNITYDSNILYGDFPIIYGLAVPGGAKFTDGYSVPANIQFKDPINELYIGTQYTGESPIFSLLDNFRISNISRPIYAPYGEPLDVNYSSNLSTVFPVTEDLFTTYLMNFDEMVVLNEDFAVLKNRKTGLFDFSVNILDSFGIVNSNIKSQEALEALIKILKPANSRVFIQYTR